jgi:HAD superfamily hydrolase (TIGR01490 family)
MQQGLALFDFDGTITSKDSLLEFIKYTSGRFGFVLVMGMFAPLILYYVFIKKDGEIAKRKVLSFLFKGKTKSELEKLGKSFADEVIPSILLPSAIEEIEAHKKRRDRVVVISASLENWLKPWTDSMKLELICTEMEYQDGKFTGRFATANCNGQEKVNRINSYLDLKQYKPVFAYGNSSGDKPMLDMADHGFYRHFE